MSSPRKPLPLMVQAAELAFATPQVVAHRVTRMALAGPTLSERDLKEFQLMGTEKAAAFIESWNAMAMQAIRTHQALTGSLISILWSPVLGGGPSASAAAIDELHNATLGVLGEGLTPLHRRAVANAKRLARTKLR